MPAWGAAGLLLVSSGSAPLSALDWQPGPGFRSAPVRVPAAGHSGFTLLEPASTGVAFTNRLAQERYLTNTMFLNGSGVAAGDVDGDGWVDLYFCGLDGPNALFRNLGNWRFRDVTSEAGLACADLDATASAFADLDGDGDLDLVVNSMGGGTWCFQNDGRGHFTRLANDPPLNLHKAGMSLALADVDGDGDLDLYVTNYRFWTYRDRPGLKLRVEQVNGQLVVTAVGGRPATEPDLVGRFTLNPGGGGFEEHGEADLLALNDGTGHFTPVSWTDGRFLDEDGRRLAAPLYDWGLTATFRDINDDGAPDLYVCNDFGSPDRLWINDGQGHFRLIARLALRSTSIFSMGVDFADINRDGLDDFFVTDMLSPLHPKRHLQIGDMKPVFLRPGEIENRPQYSRNTLFLNRGDGTYAEIGCFAGLQASEWTWMPAFLDVDLDGYEDLLISTGHELDAMNADVTRQTEAIRRRQQLPALDQLRLRTMYARFDVRKFAFRNRGDLTFEDVSSAWGFDTRSVGHGLALADLDNDGDLDLALNNLNGPAALYRNESAAPRLAVRLKGKAPNTRGLGAKVSVAGGAVPSQSQQMLGGGRYLASDDPMRVFAAGNPTNLLRVEVRWRSGLTSLLAGAQANRVYEIDEAGARPTAQSQPPRPAWAPIFEDATPLLDHTHTEEPFDDFERQPLLPYRLSQLGPGVAWHDFNGDGWDDLFIASGRGGQLAAYQNNGQGGFTRLTGAPVNRIVGRDQTTVLGVGATLFVGVSNYRDGTTNGGWVGLYDLARQVSGESLRGPTSCTGPLAMADIDGDGDLDLFVGGRAIAGRYPEPATSLLVRNQGGSLAIAQRWEKLGLVSGAVFSDLDGDGTPELILACDWGPLRVFRANGTNYVEVTRELGLADYTGWWHGVTTGDLDGDGRPDLIASNWGLNHKYRASRAEPRKLYYGDLDDNGSVDIVEAYFNQAMAKIVPERGLDAASRVLPFVQERIPTYEAYGLAGVEDIYGDALKRAAVLEAHTLASMVFFNRGDHFDAVPLPAEAQFSPAFGVCVGDVDGDGNEDVFLSQNLFAVNPDAWRNDAGRGLWLRGDGRGGLTPLRGQESGVAVYGEQRGCALADYDGDGRVDLVVTQNSAATRLFHNVRAKPGLRVRLVGPPGNPAGIGAAVRLLSGQVKGPLREVHGGSGYWSLDSAVQVMALAQEPTQIWVRWPGGQVTLADLPKRAREVAVSLDGTLRLVRSQ